MRVSDQYRLLFVHVQKTGGNTVRGMLNDALPDPRNPRGDLPKHAHLGGILKAEPGLADYYVFGFVRNPWSRLVVVVDDPGRQGQRRGRQRGRRRAAADQPVQRVVATSYDTFDEFVLRGPDDLPRVGTPQLRYLTTPRRKADFIGRTESLVADVATVFAHLGLPEIEEVPRRTPARRAGRTRTSTATRPGAGWPTSTPRTSRRSATASDPLGESSPGVV